MNSVLGRGGHSLERRNICPKRASHRCGDRSKLSLYSAAQQSLEKDEGCAVQYEVTRTRAVGDWSVQRAASGGDTLPGNTEFWAGCCQQHNAAFMSKDSVFSSQI